MSSLYNVDYLTQICRNNGLTPTKKYGQNYLIDEGVIESIMSAAALTKDDAVVEVGPGFGVLTMQLAQQAGIVISFEIEKKLQKYWAKKSLQFPNLTIQWGNVLREFPLANLQFSKYKVVANLPFQITSPVIRLFLESVHPPTELVLMVQKEVAERICASPGDMSLLSVAVQYYARAEILFTVPKTSFWPTPQVDSAVIRLTPVSTSLSKEERDYLFELVKAGFSNRRKLLIKNILPFIGKKNKDKLTETIITFGLTLTTRAQELSVENWITLCQKFSKIT
jgi:16S rRNA (adenine1518-N6/adenine1519-N6)-dimethyltransferase